VLSFAPPDDASVENLHDFVVQKGEAREVFEVMNLDALRETLRRFPGKFGVSSLSDIKILARDSNGDAVSMAKPLKHWLIFEAGDASKRYLLTLGKWYSLAEK
ncbi:DUF6119 family protein, partial [Streptomyces sp. NPDC060131]